MPEPAAEARRQWPPPRPVAAQAHERAAPGAASDRHRSRARKGTRSDAQLPARWPERGQPRRSMSAGSRGDPPAKGGDSPAPPPRVPPKSTHSRERLHTTSERGGLSTPAKRGWECPAAPRPQLPPERRRDPSEHRAAGDGASVGTASVADATAPTAPAPPDPHPTTPPLLLSFDHRRDREPDPSRRQGHRPPATPAP